MTFTNRRIIYIFLLIISFSLIFSGTSNTYAEESDHASADSLIALYNDIDYHVNALNNIYFWKPCPTDGDSSGKYGSGTCGQKLTASDPTARLREAVEKFGGFTIDMQVEYGVPWEAVFFHMYGESQMGLAGLATAVEKCGYYNTMGYVYSSRSLYGLTEAQMGGCAPHHGDNGALAAQFPSYEDMIMSYYTDYARNGLYDSAFKYLDPNNYDLEGFLKTESDIYSAAGWDGRVPGYGAYKNVWYSIKDTIYDVAKEKGWPSSAELAKQKNIPIGGKHPVNGDIKNQINAEPHSLSACDEMNKLSNDDDSSSSSEDSSDDTSSTSNNNSSNSDSDTDTDSDSGPSGTSFKIDGNTPAERFWFFEQNWYQPTDPTTIMELDSVKKGTKIDEDFGYLPYIYADNYDITYNPWPPKMTPNGGNSTRKYYWIVLPDKAFATHMGDKYVAYFEKREEPVYFITYDVWSCAHQPSDGFPNSDYCPKAQKNPDSVILGEHTIGYPSVGDGSRSGWTVVNQDLIPKLGKLTCLHRITTEDKPLVPESGKCSGAICTPDRKDEKDYPEYIQQTGHTCGPASAAMLATVASGKKVSEADVINVIGNDRAYANTIGPGMVALDQKLGDKYKFTVEQIDVSEGSKKDVIDKMREYLKKGYMIHLSGAGSTPFTGGGHYIGIFNIDNDDNVLVADSNLGNKTYKLSDVVNAGYHGTAFSAIKGEDTDVPCAEEEGRNAQCSAKSDSDSDSTGNGSCSDKVLSTVDKLIDLAQKNGSTYVYGGGHDADGSSYFNSILENGAHMGVDCTGFASLVMYATFGVKETFATSSIAGNSNYKEVPKSDIQPGDIFAYNYGCTAHGGIIIEVNNGRITKIAQTGRSSYITEGFGGKNSNIGYTSDPGGNAGNMSCANGGASDVKYYRYKGCN